MFTAKFLTRTISIVTVLMLALSGVSPAFAVGTNDNFANATQIFSLPYNVNQDNYSATFEAGEPTPTCGYGYNLSTIWYSYTPSANTSLTATSSYYYFPPVLAVYFGSFGNLTQVACGNYYPNLTFQAQAGVTYYFQLDSYYPGNQGPIPFSLQVTPPPTAGICFGPSDPSIFDTMQFNDCSSDPGGVGFQSFTWNFGDGTTLTTTSCCVNHQYAADGDYTFQHTVTTVDGRTDTTSLVIHVRTKDIAITTFSVPQTARVNQTKTINVNVQNKRYSDYVQVTLIKGLPGGGEQVIGTLTIYVPAKAKQATTFKFSYTFTSDDAKIGKVTFKAIATIVNGRDALPSDNTAIATTLVNGASYP
jgi:PKD domain-containing protein